MASLTLTAIDPGPSFGDPSKLLAVVAELNREEIEEGTGWTYKIRTIKPGMGYIEVYDEAGNLLGPL